MAIGLITGSGQITPEWMTSVLASSNTIDAATSVSTIDVRDIGEDGERFGELSQPRSAWRSASSTA